MFKNAKTAAASGLIAATFAMGMVGAAPAHAGNTCKKVAMEFTNDHSHKINIVDVDYWDPAKGRNGGWRSIGVFNETLQSGDTWDETRNLKKVNQRSTRIRFEYRKPGKLGGWSFKKYKVESDSFTCNRRDNVEVSTND